MLQVETKTKVLTAHVPVGLAEKIDRIAQRLDRSRGWVMRQALSAWVAEEDERDRLTREAMVDVDTGTVISHANVRAWADSLSSDQPLPRPTP